MSITDAFRPALDTAARQVDGDPDDIRDHVLGLARAWERSELPIREVRRLSAPAERFVAMGRSIRNVDDRRLLVRLSDALLGIQHEVTGQGVYRTTSGLFTSADLRGANARVRYERIVDPQTGEVTNDFQRIDFPIRDDGVNATYGETTADRRRMADEDARKKH